MTNINCNLCGAVNGVADEICKVCGAELQSPFRYDESSPPPGNDIRRPKHDVIRPFDGVGSILGPTINLFFGKFWLITKIVFVIVAPFEIFKVLSLGTTKPDWQLMVGIIALHLLTNALVVPALYYALVKVIETGSEPGVNEAYLWGLSKIPGLILSAVMSWVMIMLGCLLFIIPGIFLGLAFHVVYPVAVFEKVSAVDVLERSYKLTQRRRLRILLALIVLAILGGLCTRPVVLITQALVVDEVSYLLLAIPTAIFIDIVTKMPIVFSLVVYLSILRALGRRRSVIE
jgi:hypothetical protein